MARGRSGYSNIYRNRNLFDYSTSGGPIQEDFGAIGKMYLDGVKHVEEVKRSVDEQIRKTTQEAIEKAEVPLTGNEMYDRGAAVLGQRFRDDIYNNRQRIGKNGYTVNDYNQMIAKSMGSAAAFVKNPEYLKKTREEILAKGDKASGAQLAILDHNLGKVFSREAVNTINVKDGSLVIDRGERDENGNTVWFSTDVKEFMSSGPEDIAMFDKLKEAESFRDIFVNKNKDFLPPEIVDLDSAQAKAFITGHIESTPENYKQLKETYVNELSKHDIVSYMHDHLGYQPGDGSGNTYRVANGTVIFDPENNKEDKRKLDEVRKSFSQYLDESFGVKTTKNAQIVRLGGGSSASLKMINTYGDAGGIIQKTVDNPEEKEFYDDSGYRKSFSMSDIAKSYEIGTTAFATAAGETTPEQKILGFNNAVDVIRQKSDRIQVNETVAKDQFKRMNNDLFVEATKKIVDASGKVIGEQAILEDVVDKEGKVIGKRNVLEPRKEKFPESIAEVNKTIQFRHMSLGVDLDASDVARISKTNATGQDFENLSGIVVSYRNGYVGNTEEPFDPAKVINIPQGIRIIGQADYQSTQVLSGGQPQKTSALGQQGVGLVSERSTVMSSPSALLDKNKIQALTNALIKSDKTFQNRLAVARAVLSQNPRTKKYANDPMRVLIEALGIK